MSGRLLGVHFGKISSAILLHVVLLPLLQMILDYIKLLSEKTKDNGAKSTATSVSQLPDAITLDTFYRRRSAGRWASVWI